MGLCIGMLIVSLAGLTIYAVLTGGARKEFSALAQRVEVETVSLPTEQVPDAYAGLKDQNPDFVGWIKLEGATINYPVVQTKAEPEYYLRRSFEGRYSIAGTPFLDARCDMENGAGLIVYGHNMNDGSMFADLEGYLEEGYWREHPVIQCDSLTQRREYEVLAVLHLKDSKQTAADYYTVPQDEAGFAAWVERIKAGALYETGVTAQWGEQVLVLSTCDKADSTARIFVAAKKPADS